MGDSFVLVCDKNEPPKCCFGMNLNQILNAYSYLAINGRCKKVVLMEDAEIVDDSFLEKLTTYSNRVRDMTKATMEIGV